MTKIRRKKKSKYSQNRPYVVLGLVITLCLALGTIIFIGSQEGESRDDDGGSTSRFQRNGERSQLGPSFKTKTKISTKNELEKRSPFDLVAEGYLHLIDISISQNPFQSQGNDSPYSVMGTFCHLNWVKHKKDPASIPMFKDLQNKSKDCPRSRVQIDLFAAVSTAREYDAKDQGVSINAMDPKGFVFHESRCGSTLVANSLAVFDAKKNRVYSESGPPITAVKAFNSKFEKESIQLVRDVIYLMGRTNDLQEENLFFKIQSIGSKSIWAFRKVFPTTPWIYVYRDPVQVMKSHLKTKGTTMAVCLRSQRRPPMADIAALTQEISSTSPDQLTTEQYCAAHLATLCLAAEKEISDAQGVGRLVNYAELPNILIEDIVPSHFLKEKAPLSAEATEMIMKVTAKYSKGRNTNKAWKEDSEQKEATAWEEMRDASNEYLYPVYKRMEALRINT